MIRMFRKILVFSISVLTWASVTSASTDFTTYADLHSIFPEMKLIIKCVPQITMPSEYMDVVVRKSLDDSKLQLVVSRSHVGHDSQDVHDVRYIDPGDHRLGAPVLYQGPEVQLAIYWTASPSPQGFPALLKTQGAPIELRCKRYTQYEN